MPPGPCSRRSRNRMRSSTCTPTGGCRSPQAGFLGKRDRQSRGVPELSASAFTAYQQDLAEVLESFASKGGWVCMDTSPLGVAEAGSAVADIAERHFLPAAAVTAHIGEDGYR